MFFFYHNRLLLPSFLNLFVTNNFAHSYLTRKGIDYRYHQFRTNVKYFFVFFSRTKIWNSLYYLIRHFETLFSLKRHLQSPLLNRLIYWWSRLMVWQQKYSQWTRIARKYSFFLLSKEASLVKAPWFREGPSSIH